MSNGLMIMKLRPQYDEAFPPGYFQNRERPPADFDGHTWLASLPKNVIQADINQFLYRQASYFNDQDIWYYACFPHQRRLQVWQLCNLYILRSILPSRVDQAMLISANPTDRFSSAVVFHAKDRRELGKLVLEQMCLLVDDWKGHDPRVDWQFWDKYDAPKWYRRWQQGADLLAIEYERVIP